MNNNTVLLLTGRFIFLVLLQVLLLNHINFLGYLDPYLYIIFIILYPFYDNRLPFIFNSFLIGFAIDLFCDSGGTHAAACVLIAYMRPFYTRLAFGSSFEQQSQGFQQASIAQRWAYILFMILTHHLALFLLETFSIVNLMYVLQKTLFTGIFTFILSILSISLFSKK